MSRSILVTLRHAPYGSSLPRAALDLALATAAFGQAVTLLFLGDGVLQLLPDQDAAGIGLRNQGKTLASLPLYDVETVYAEAAALQHHGIPVTVLPAMVEVVDAAAMRALLAGSDHLLGF